MCNICPVLVTAGYFSKGMICNLVVSTVHFLATYSYVPWFAIDSLFVPQDKAIFFIVVVKHFAQPASRCFRRFVFTPKDQFQRILQW